MNSTKLRTERCTTTSAVMLYADGELDPAKSLEVEAHLEGCESCREELDLAQAVRKSLRRSASRRAPEALESRLKLLVESELPRLPADDWSQSGRARATRTAGDARAAGARAAEPRRDAGAQKRVFAGGFTVLAAAAAIGGLWLSRSSDSTEGASAKLAKLAPATTSGTGDGAKPSAVSATANAALNFDSLIEELVQLHADPLPPETTNPDELLRLEPFVGVPVKRSALRLLEADAELGKPQFDGARIHSVREHQRAAALQYSVRGHRLTMYVFDSRGVPMRVSRLERRELPTAEARVGRVPANPTKRERGPVYVGTMRGYSVAATEHGGVGYALASDLDPEKNALMMASF